MNSTPFINIQTKLLQINQKIPNSIVNSIVLCGKQSVLTWGHIDSATDLGKNTIPFLFSSIILYVS